MGCAMGTVRYILFFFNFLLALAGLGILVLGILTARMKGASFDDMLKGQLTTPAIVFAIVGACVFIFAFFGCCGALRESHCMITTYAVLLLTLFLLQVAVAVLAFTYRGRSEEVIKANADNIYQDYNKLNSDNKKLIDSLQTELHCCGSTDPQTPWATMGIPAPDSCYGTNSEGIKTEYSEGCIPTVVTLVEEGLTAIGEVAIAVGVVEVIGIIFSLCLANSIRRQELRGYA